MLKMLSSALVHNLYQTRTKTKIPISGMSEQYPETTALTTISKVASMHFGNGAGASNSENRFSTTQRMMLLTDQQMIRGIRYPKRVDNISKALFCGIDTLLLRTNSRKRYRMLSISSYEIFLHIGKHLPDPYDTSRRYGNAGREHMPEQGATIADTTIIPPASRERFLSVWDSPRMDTWANNGVTLGGVSELESGYLVHRPACIHHFIGYVLCNSVWYLSDEGKVELHPGTLFFLRAGTLHHYESSQPFSMLWLHLSPEHPRWEYLSRLNNCHRVARCLDDIRNVMERALVEAQSPEHATDRVNEAICNLMLAYIDREMGHRFSDTELALRQRLEKVWDTVSSNLMHPWDVRGLARLASMSPSHFHAAVTQIYQTSPMQIVRKFRIERAQALLINSACKLEIIAELTGYDSPFSLSRAFKAVTHVSPREYRQASRSNN